MGYRNLDFLRHRFLKTSFSLNPLYPFLGHVGRGFYSLILVLIDTAETMTPPMSSKEAEEDHLTLPTIGHDEPFGNIVKKLSV